jgi:hypothetical protein
MPRSGIGLVWIPAVPTDEKKSEPQPSEPRPPLPVDQEHQAGGRADQPRDALREDKGDTRQ